MTILPFYEPRILTIPLEKYAEIAIDGGIWLVGERLQHRLRADIFLCPVTATVSRPGHEDTPITRLSGSTEHLSNGFFVPGFFNFRAKAHQWELGQ